MPRVHTHILIADPHVLFRRGLRTVLSNEPDFDVTDDESSLSNLLTKLSLKSDEDPTYPDALLVSDELIRECPVQHADALSELQARSVVLALTSQGSPERQDAIPRDSAPADIVTAVRKAVEVRRTGFSYSLNALQQQVQPATAEQRTPALTSRETEIVRLLAEGLTARDTARELSLSVKTVEAHKLNVMRKLGVHRRAELLSYAEQNGLVLPAPVL